MRTFGTFAVGEHEHTIVGYSLVKGIGDGEPIASERFSVGGHEWVSSHCVLAAMPHLTLFATVTYSLLVAVAAFSAFAPIGLIRSCLKSDHCFCMLLAESHTPLWTSCA